MTQTIIKVPAAGAFDPTDIEITDNTSGAFLIQDSATEYYRINSGTSGPQYALRTGLSSQYLIQNGAGSGYTQLRNGSNNQFYMTGSSTTQAFIKFFSHDQYSGGFFRIRDSGSAEIFRVDEDSNTTFTLDSGNSALFKVQDDSANEYINVDTTSGSEQMILKGNPGGSGTLGAAGLYLVTNPYFQGSDSNNVQLSTSGISLQTGNAGNRCDVYAANPGNSFRVLGTGNTERFKVEDDSTTTLTLADGTGATFTITDNESPTPRLHLRCTESATSTPTVEVNGLRAFPTKQLSLTSVTYGTAFQGSINQARTSVSLGATSTTRNVSIGAVSMDNFAQILTATPSTTGQTFTLDFNNTSTSLSGLPIGLYKLVLKNAGTQSCTFTAASTMASGGRVKGVDVSGASIGVIDSSSGSITAAAGETIYVEVTNHVSDSAGTDANRFIICKTICKI